MVKLNKRQVGAQYEELAANYLAEQGYDILERNYRNRFGELDIIAGRDGVIVYVEVKYRHSGHCGDPMESVDRKKQRQISRVALYHYARNGAEEGRPCRFDVIAVYGDGSITHIENAFNYQK